MANDIFQDVDSAVKKLLPQIEAVKKSVDGLATSLIQLDKTTKTTAKSQSDLKQKSQQLSTVDKELIKLDKQLERAEAQLTEEYKQVQKAALKKAEAVKKSNAAIKEEITGAKAAREATQAQKKATQELNRAHSEAIRINKQLEKAKVAAKIKKEKDALKAAALAQRNFNKAHAEAIKINDKFNKSQKKSGGLFKSMTKSILAAGAAMFGVNAVIGVAKKVFGDAFNKIKGFEKGMSEVRAVVIDSKLPLEEQNRQFEALKESAKELGSVTPKTASEVAGLQKEFAKLGFSSAEILAATEATINLSIAAGSDLAQSATVAASTIRGFGMSANETQRVVDVMSKSFSSSALDLNKFQTAMATVAPVAKSAGKDIEFTTAQLGVLTDAGLDASTAGTSLRNMFLELGKKGLTWEQGLEKIKKSTDKNNTALELFGKRGVTAGLILAENTEKSAALESELRKAAGTAQEMADVMADNLAGDIDKAKSAWEGMILSIEDGSGVFNKIFRGAVQSVTNELGNLTMMFKGINSVVEDEMLDTFDRYVGKLKETKTNEEILVSLEKTRVSLLEQLEGATKKQTKAININLAAIDKTIDRVKASVQADEDAAKAAIEAAEEQERIRTQLAEEEAQKRADARERIQIKAAKKRAAFLNAQGAKEVDDFIAQLERENEAFEDLLDERGEINIEAVRTQLTAEEEAIKASNERKLQMQEQLEEGKKELISAGIDAAEKIVTDRFNAGIDERLNSTLEGIESEKQILQDQLDKKQITEEQFRKKTKALNLKARQEEAKANKKKSQFDNVINTLVAVGKTFATLGFPAGIIPAAIVAGIGAANGIAIAAEPIPKFRMGVENFDGGLADVHTGEIIKTKDGSMFKTPAGETRIYLPPSAGVIPQHKAEPIIKEAEKSGLELQVLKSIDKKLSRQNNNVNVTMTPKSVEYWDSTKRLRKKYLGNRIQ